MWEDTSRIHLEYEVNTRSRPGKVKGNRPQTGAREAPVGVNRCSSRLTRQTFRTPERANLHGTFKYGAFVCGIGNSVTLHHSKSFENPAVGMTGAGLGFARPR